MLRHLAVLARIAFRNLFASWMNVIIGGVMLLGTALFVIGGSLLDTLDRSMSQSIIGSVAGHAQVYSERSKDELELFGGMGGTDSDLSPIADFGQVRRILEADVPNVRQVIPMGLKGALVTSGNTIDVTLARLRKAVNEERGGGAPDATQRVHSLKQHVRQIVRVLDEERKNASALLDEGAIEPRMLEAIARASSEGFWAEFDQAPLDALEFLENRIAPLLPDGDLLFIRYMGTDLQAFAQAFDRLELTSGELVPPGKRGYLMPSFAYEEGFKLKSARRLDRIREGLATGRTLAGDPELARFVRENLSQTRDILLQLDPLKAKEATARLRRALGTSEGELEALLRTLLNTDDANFAERYRIFYEELAPLLELYRVRIGDDLTIQAFTQAGFMESVKVKVYGTFQFKGLEKSPLAGVTGLMDLMSFRDLYGFVTPEQQEEIRQLKEQSGAQAVSRDEAEALLFGAEAQVVAEGTSSSIDEAEQLGAREGPTAGDGEERTYSQQELESGVVLNAAVMLKDPSKLDQTIEELSAVAKRRGLGLKVVSWQKAAGLIGQFVLMAKIVLHVAVFIIFVVALVIINNSVMMATLQRVREIGTMRAIGAQRGFVLAMVLAETVLLGLLAGAVGIGIGAAVVGALHAKGIPATTDELYFFFSGPALHPTLSSANMLTALAIVFAVSAISTFYPATVATRVSPVQAMQTED
jgi:ABC-type lipoprotein release transport system permease subunit